MKKDLKKLYKEWRTQIEEHNKEEIELGGSHNIYGTWDCGESCAREDFTNYAELEEEITFEEMLELEREYK